MMRNPCRCLSLGLVVVGLSSLGATACSTSAPGQVNRVHSFLGLGTSIEGSGRKASENRSVGEFDGIDVSGAFHVEVAQGTPTSVVVEAEDNLLGLIQTRLEDGMLKVQTTESIHPHERMTVRVTTPSITRLHIGGASDAEVQPLRSQQLTISLSGASTVRMASLYADSFAVDASGASRLSVTESGKVNSMVVKLSGSSAAKLATTEVTDATVEATGASKLLVRVVDRLNGEISGASEVEHIGSPKTLSIETSGASAVRQRR